MTDIATPEIVQTKDELYAFIHLQVPRGEMPSVIQLTLHEIHAALKAQGLPIESWFAHHLVLRDGDFDFEVCLPTTTAFLPTGRVQKGLWPASRVARAFYQGDYPGLPTAWQQLSLWIKQSGHTYATHIYERYVVNRGTTQDPTKFVTEMSWPLL